MDKLSKKISIVLLIYNIEEYISEYVNKLIDKCNDINYEILLLDEGSDDDSAKICLSYQKNNNNCIYVQTYSHDNEDNIRYGVHIAEGEYFYTITSNDIKNNIIPENLFLYTEEFSRKRIKSITYSKKTYTTTGITIVITSYNKENYIQRAIQSVKKIANIEWECIIVDNNSTDNSVAVVLENIKNDNRFKLITQVNKNVCHARNIGAWGGIGKYLTFLDGDDEIKENYCAVAVDRMEKNHRLCIASGYFTRFYSDGTYANYKTMAGEFNKLSYKDRIRLELVRNQFTVTSIIRTDRFKKINGFKKGTEYTQEDWEMFIRYFYCDLNNIDVCFIEDFVLSMYMVKDSKTELQTQDYGNKPAEMLNMYNENPNIYEQFFSSEEINSIKNKTFIID